MVTLSDLTDFPSEGNSQGEIFGSQVIYRVSQEEGTKLWESVPYVKIYRYNPKHLYPKLNSYGDNGREKCGLLAGLRTVPCQLTTLRMSVLYCRVRLQKYR